MHRVLPCQVNKNKACSVGGLSLRQWRMENRAFTQDALAALVAREAAQAPGLCQLRPISDAFLTLCNQLTSGGNGNCPPELRVLLTGH